MRAPLGTRAWRKLTFMVTAGSAGGEAAAGRGEEALEDILAESVGEVKLGLRRSLVPCAGDLRPNNARLHDERGHRLVGGYG
jgi:hypothetical protein